MQTQQTTIQSVVDQLQTIGRIGVVKFDNASDLKVGKQIGGATILAVMSTGEVVMIFPTVEPKIKFSEENSLPHSGTKAFIKYMLVDPDQVLQGKITVHAEVIKGTALKVVKYDQYSVEVETLHGGTVTLGVSQTDAKGKKVLGTIELSVPYATPKITLPESSPLKVKRGTVQTFTLPITAEVGDVLNVRVVKVPTDSQLDVTWANHILTVDARHLLQAGSAGATIIANGNSNVTTKQILNIVVEDFVPPFAETLQREVEMVEGGKELTIPLPFSEEIPTTMVVKSKDSQVEGPLVATHHAYFDVEERIWKLDITSHHQGMLLIQIIAENGTKQQVTDVKVTVNEDTNKTLAHPPGDIRQALKEQQAETH